MPKIVFKTLVSNAHAASLRPAAVIPLPPVAGSDRESKSGQRIRHWEQMMVCPYGAPPPAGHPSRLQTDASWSG